MRNSFFNFKQFTVQQERCAMKVCTDACLFGAWVAESIAGHESINNILDIGAGTGLLSLMLAQKNNASIDAVELNADAALQAKENFNSSPWNDRLNIFETDILKFEANKKYDFIISNPPFFEDDLKSDSKDRNTAMHSTTLNLEVLLQQIKRLINEEGMAAVILPFHRHEYFEKLLGSYGFFVVEAMHVKQSVNHDFFRSQYIFGKKEVTQSETHIAIHDAERQYTTAFTSLLKDYYLKL